MSALADRSLGQLLEQVAAESPSPGGGSSCALTCALAAGLVEMAAAFTLSRAEYAERHERMAAVRGRAGERRHVDHPEDRLLSEQLAHRPDPTATTS